MKYEALTYKIIGCAQSVFNTLGFGFLESVYKKAMIIELNKVDLIAEAEKALKVYYENQVVGDYFIDLYIEDNVVVELKSVETLSKQHEVQLVNYLNGMKKDIGLLINFSPSGIDVKRKYRSPQKGRSIIWQDPQDYQDISFPVSERNQKNITRFQRNNRCHLKQAYVFNIISPQATDHFQLHPEAENKQNPINPVNPVEKELECIWQDEQDKMNFYIHHFPEESAEV